MDETNIGILLHSTSIFHLNFIIFNSLEVVLELTPKYVFYVKLESSCYIIHYAIRFGSIDQELDSIDRKSGRMFFL